MGELCIVVGGIVYIMYCLQVVVVQYVMCTACRWCCMSCVLPAGVMYVFCAACRWCCVPTIVPARYCVESCSSIFKTIALCVSLSARSAQLSTPSTRSTSVYSHHYLYFMCNIFAFKYVELLPHRITHTICINNEHNFLLLFL